MIRACSPLTSKLRVGVLRTYPELCSVLLSVGLANQVIIVGGAAKRFRRR